jgi:hypothetical protein
MKSRKNSTIIVSRRRSPGRKYEEEAGIGESLVASLRGEAGVGEAEPEADEVGKKCR